MTQKINPQVYVCHTVFHLFISLVKAMVQKDLKFYILVPDFLKFKPTIFVGKYVADVITYSYLQMDKDWANYKAKHPLSLFSYTRELRSVIESNFDSARYRSLFSDADFFVFNDGSPFVAYLMLLYKKNNFTLIEDGEAIYTDIKRDLKYYLKKLSGYPISFGHSKYINHLEVRFPERLSHKTKCKSHTLLLEEMQDSLNRTQKEDLLDFFKVTQLDSTDKFPVLVLTQPLSEDGLVEEEYKINLYKQIIAQHKGDGQVFIKAHPREITDYSVLFPECVVLSHESPVELLGFVGCTFSKAVTLFSTSIHSVPAKEKVFLSLDYDLKIKKAWMNYMGVKTINA